MLKNRKILTALLLTLLATGFMLFIESALKPGYFLKSLLKLTMFAGSILLYSFINRLDPFNLINLNRNKPAKWLIIAVVFAYAGIITAYLILRNYIDLSSIRDSLLNKEGLTRNNFIFIFGYIILINSFLEEAFFRGFIVNVFKREGYLTFGSLYSAVLFAIYHLGIVSTWFNPFILILCIGGLAIVGLFLQYISQSQKNLAASWLVHASANLAINTIGTIMLFS